MEQNTHISSWRNYTRHQWTVLTLFSFVNMFAGMMYSIQAPFFPALVEKKNLSSFDSGTVFSVYHLTGFFVSPLLGAHMSSIQPKTGIYAGAIIAGTSAVCFGFLDRINDSLWFLSMAVILRIIEGIGTTTLFVYLNSSVTLEFTTSAATAFAQMETSFALGSCVGPVVGELFYQLGGFTMPFTMLGGILISSSVVLHCFLATPGGDTEKLADSNDKENSSSKLGILNLLKISTVLGSAYGSFVVGFELGFMANTLEQHVRQFNLSATLIGACFLLYGAVYALSAPLLGSICDRINEPNFVTVAGAIFFLTAFLAIGPAPFIPIKPILWLTWIGLILFGLGMAAIFVSTFMSILRDARKHNYPDSVQTYGCVTGIWYSSVSLGALMGPIISGVLQDHFGFRMAEYSVLSLSASLVFVSIASILTRRLSTGDEPKAGIASSAPAISEESPLLSNT